MKYILVLLSLFLLTSCSTISSSLTNASTTKAANTNAKNTSKTVVSTNAAGSKTKDPDVNSQYTIQPGDALHISVWKERDLQKEVLVRADGKISFPLVRDIMAGGLTYEEFKKNLTARLSRYVPHPSITISVIRPLGNKIFVIGKVNKPGEIVNTRNLDVMQALSVAGGLNPFASEKRIKILRRINGKLTAIPFNYNKVKKGKNLEQNIILRSGDIIVVR